MATTYPLHTLDGTVVVDPAERTIRLMGQSGSLDSATATVDTAGALEKRITATRIALTGVFALAWRKKQDNRELYLLIEGEDYSWVARVDPDKGADARKFAAGINTLAKGGSVSPGQMGEDARTEMVEAVRAAKEQAKRNAMSPAQQKAQDTFHMVLGVAVVLGILALGVWLLIQIFS